MDESEHMNSVDPHQALFNINLDGLGKAAHLLVEKLSNACGMVYAPTHLRRMAEAEGDADLIQYRKSRELGAFRERERAMIRFIGELGRQQANIEAIVNPVVAQIPESANVEEVEEDWLAEFSQKCRNTSNAEMQSYWSRLLHSECNSPGKNSKRVVDALSKLSGHEARMFDLLNNHSWIVGGGKFLIVPQLDGVLSHKADFFHLSDAGLIDTTALTTIRVCTGEVVQYGPSRWTCLKDNPRFNPGNAMFTTTGYRLSEIIEQKFTESARSQGFTYLSQNLALRKQG